MKGITQKEIVRKLNNLRSLIRQVENILPEPDCCKNCIEHTHNDTIKNANYRGGLIDMHIEDTAKAIYNTIPDIQLPEKVKPIWKHWTKPELVCNDHDKGFNQAIDEVIKLNGGGNDE